MVITGSLLNKEHRGVFSAIGNALHHVVGGDFVYIYKIYIRVCDKI